MNVTLSRLDYLYLAKVADQAERYHGQHHKVPNLLLVQLVCVDVIAQLKSIISFTDAQLTVDERNLLSIAYKNITASLRGSWRTIDTLQKREARHASWQQVLLMRRQKERIEQDLDSISKDVVELLERFLIPAANPGEEKVFYCKMCARPLRSPNTF